jgi:outer membrane biosynthesis protein TonB
MRYAPTVNDDSLNVSLKVSAGLHLLMFLFLYFGLPRLVTPLPAHHEPVPFDIVTIAELTNTRINDETQEQAQTAAPPPVPQPKPQVPAPSAPPKVEPKVEEAIEALKPKPIEKPKPPEQKPATVPEKPAPPQDLLGSVLKNVAKMKPAEPTKGVDQKADGKTTSAGAALGPVFSTRLTITEEDALRRQIEQCWNPPVGARDAQNLIVEVIIDVNPDRTVANAEIVDKGRYASDPFFRAAADSAVRAVRSPKCSPLELSVDKYEQWKRINFTFDPREML